MSHEPVDRRLILETVSFAVSSLDDGHLDIAALLLRELETRLLTDELTIGNCMFDGGVQSSFRH